MSIKTFIRDLLLKTRFGVRLFRRRYFNVARKREEEIAKKFPEFDRPTDGRPCLLFDVSAAANGDQTIGVSRVTRELFLAFSGAELQDHVLIPIANDGIGFRYVDRETVTEKLFSFQKCDLLARVRAEKGDIFFSPDIPSLRIVSYIDTLISWKKCGVKLFATIHDLIPIREPQMGDLPSEMFFTDYIKNVLTYYDGIIAISRYVSDDILDYARSIGLLRTEIKVGWVHNGVCKKTTKRSRQRVDGRFLMVGTLDDRKGYSQVIDGFERLWAKGLRYELVIVGRTCHFAGSPLHIKIADHPELGKKLSWLSDASDDDLAEMYATSNALIYASNAEGFGLPLIEAAQNELPIICRDHPLYREVAGDHAFYFDDSKDPQVIAEAVERWIELDKRGEAPRSKEMPFMTWEESAERYINIIVNNNWN